MGILKKISVLLCVFAFGCSYSVFGTKKAPDSYDLNDAFKSVVKISMAVNMPEGSGEVSGTAWAIDGDHLITASHVCMAFVNFEEMGFAGDTFITYLDDDYNLQKFPVTEDIKMLISDSVNDVCLIELEDHGFTPLKLAKDVAFGEKVYVVGAPMGFLGFVFEGRVANKSISLSPMFKDKLIISAAATGGNSGGPVLNSSGEVVGILIAGATDFDHFSICTGLDSIRQIVKALIK